MNSRVLPKEGNLENAAARGRIKATTAGKAPAIRRGVLGDLANTIHTLQNEPEPTKNAFVKPLQTKKIEALLKKPISTVDKENLEKKHPPKQLNKKLIRQESTTNLPKDSGKGAKEAPLYDPDENSREDPHMMAEYTEDVLSYIRSLENEFPIRPDYLDNSKVTPKMRKVLVNWLIEAHEGFSMVLETLHLCVSLVDRYLQINKSVDRSTLQLVGAGAMLLAAKYEEVYCPDPDDYVLICDYAFTKEQFHQMERNICKAIDFRMGWPLSIFFLRRYSKIARATAVQHNMAKYFLELTLLHHSMAHIKPSIQAAAACCLSIAVVTELNDPSKAWTATLAHYTKYKFEDFKQCLPKLAKIIAEAEISKFDAVKQKYSKSKYNKVSGSFKLKGPLIRELRFGLSVSMC